VIWGYRSGMVADHSSGDDGVLLVRRYQQEDAPACCHVINEAVLGMDGLNPPARHRVHVSNTPARLDRDLRSWHTLVCEHGTLGLIAVGAFDANEIKRVYVRPDAQGRGAGRTLMAALEHRAHHDGCRTLRLEASPSAVSFYESLGYSAEDEACLVVDDAVFRFVRMSKQI
jgi:GNAT superfamily N-acetyltransferase